MDDFIKKHSVAAELFSAAWCNLDCRYCYIPKHNTMISDKHKEIVEQAKQGQPLVDKLKRLYGENLESLSHWGSEPTLTVQHFKRFYELAIPAFPKLKTITMSSNFLGPVDDLIDFVLTFSKERQFSFRVQVSLDGPPWICDPNRGRIGAAEDIVKNYCRFLEELNRVKLFHRVSSHFKPTLARDQYAGLLEGDGVREYYRFFDDVAGRVIDANTHGQVAVNLACDPTIVCPDDYTSRDGKMFNRIYEKSMAIRDEFPRLKIDSGYYAAFRRLAIFGDEYFTKQKMFTCSAGDSQFGVDDHINPCHDTFYLNLSGHRQAMVNDPDRVCSPQEKTNIENGTYGRVSEALTLAHDAPDQGRALYFYRLRGFHDFVKNRLSTAIAIVLEMAYAGQVSSCYKYRDMAYLLAAYVLTRHSCPTGNMANSGFMGGNPMAYYRLFGNGLIENFLRRYLGE